MSSFTKVLNADYLGSGRWKITEPFEYFTEDGVDVILVPIGFVSDGASIPRIFWTIIGSPWTGKYAKAAVVHDFLYDRQLFTRKKSDRIFIEGMKILGVGWFKRKIMWFSVRVGGWGPWRKHKKELKNE